MAHKLSIGKCKSNYGHLLDMLEKTWEEMINDDHGGDASIYNTLDKYIIYTINTNISSNIANMCMFKFMDLI